jgi:hypothetical protein
VRDCNGEANQDEGLHREDQQFHAPQFVVSVAPRGPVESAGSNQWDATYGGYSGLQALLPQLADQAVGG